MKRRHPKSLVYTFRASIFIPIAIAIVFTGILISVLIQAHVMRHLSPLVFVVYTAVLVISTSIIVARLVGNRVAAPIKELIQAIREVAGGTFTITVKDDDTNIKEVQDMIRSFNIMVRELENIEIIHSDFTRNVSHEFKTPLSVIEGYTALLQAPHVDDEKRSLYASKIMTSTKRLSALAGNILELSRLENEQLGLKQETFALDEQLRQIVLMYENEWRRKNLDIDIELPEISYCGNEDLLFQVWQNIFVNAVKFSNENGKIRITVKEIPDFVLVSIEDNGIGIPEEDKKRIFEKFFQGDRSHSAEGNGLGLAISKKIVELHKGSIKVTSRQSAGAEFTVMLPVAI